MKELIQRGLSELLLALCSQLVVGASQEPRFPNFHLEMITSVQANEPQATEQCFFFLPEWEEHLWIVM